MGHLKMTRRLKMSVSQKLASWKGSAKDAKAGKNIISVNQRHPRLNIIEFSAFSAVKFFKKSFFSIEHSGQVWYNYNRQ
jgi:hypothetical protein